MAAGIRLEWAQFGDFDSFDVIRSDTSLSNVANNHLPPPIATNIQTMYFVDTGIETGKTYYYMVRIWRGEDWILSDEIVIFANFNSIDFIFDLSEEYTPPIANAVNFNNM